jgi:sulfur relay (sulfurtransferase) DsrC/TusE family protein
MVQIIPKAKSTGDRFAQAFNNLGESASTLIPEEIQGRKERKQLGSLIGKDVSDIRNPDFLKLLLQNHGKQSNNQGELENGLMDYDTVKKFAGQDVADFYKASPVGGKTKIVQAIIEGMQRGQKFGDMLGNNLENKKPETNSGEYKLNTEGMTPKETNDFKMNLRKENSPIWKDTVDKNKSYRELDTDIGILSKLNEKKKLPTGFSKLLINPETGAPYEAVSAVKDMPTDVQQWVKTIARQATQAQTSFPGRVTNFDLMSYMRQFPNLFNTYDGRKVILKQMKLTNEAHKLMTESLNKVYNKYKLSGITPEDAEDMAHENVKGRLEEIDKELLNLASEGEILADESKDEKKSNKMIDVIGPDGQLYEIDEAEVKLLPQGYKVK